MLKHIFKYNLFVIIRQSHIFVFLLIIIFFSSELLFSQKQGYLRISGQVKSGKDKIANATINLYENNTKINSITSNANGDFTFNLNFDKVYMIEVSATNYVSKKVLVDTKVPDKELIYKYTFTVDLFVQVDGVDYSILNKPVTKIVYNDEADAFDYDLPYTESMRKEIDKIVSQIENNRKQAYNQIIAKADELFKNQQYHEAITLYEKAIDIDPYNDYPDKQIMACEKMINQLKNNENNYQKFITQGDNLFSKQDYVNAKNAYQNALNLKPSEQYPKNKIAEIDKLIAEKAAKEKAEAEARAKEEQYKAAIAKGDAALAKQNFDEAKTAYNQALNIKPNESYPKNKIAEIDKLIAEKAAKEKAEAEARAKEEQYKAAIAKGDAAFEKLQLDEAKQAYQEALNIKPNETYPKNKMVEIDHLLSQRQKKEQEIQEKEKAYKEAIQKGDNFYLNKDYSTAITYYQTALKYKPNETYPRQRISECQEQLKRRYEEEQKRLAEERQKQIEEQQAKLKKLEEVNFNDKQSVEKYLSELARTYPEGVTEELYEDKTKKIKRVIVNREGVATEYRQVTHNWGGEYFFRNGQSISKNIFLIETKK